MSPVREGHEPGRLAGGGVFTAHYQPGHATF